MQPLSLLPLVVQNLSYKVNEKLLLDNINATVNSTGVSVVLGANGAGKSLFVRLLHGLLPSEQQTIKWNDQVLDLVIRKRQALVRSLQRKMPSRVTRESCRGGLEPWLQGRWW